MEQAALAAVARMVLEASVASRHWGVPVTLRINADTYQTWADLVAPDGEKFGETERYPLSDADPDPLIRWKPLKLNE